MHFETQGGNDPTSESRTQVRTNDHANGIVEWDHARADKGQYHKADHGRALDNGGGDDAAENTGKGIVGGASEKLPKGIGTELL
ncbi:hypothetical protein GCM10007876_32560 [Litoribrevibacter albus]|uniref:Uncharacterized protein n=1 Tax=Litoribrevibacter albus TaxID=1473156 RepID=A0AA37SEC7_9GAMM|nr:hypothetical protein GCM10007876_32560 [Litoribrevibacter albus]